MTIEFNRADYMDGKCTHHEYYSQFASEGLLKAVADRIGSERILNSDDKHLNDIPLIEWDRLQGLVMSHCETSLRASNGTGGVSLSDCVCVAKAAAKIYQESEKTA